jgi:hypothetical protein
MKKDFLIKILNKYMDKMGNDHFVEEYGVDSDNLPLKIVIEDIDKDNSRGDFRMFISVTPKELSHTIDYLDTKHNEYTPISYDDAVIESIIEALTSLGFGHLWNKFRYFINAQPIHSQDDVYIDEQKNKNTKVRTFDKNIHENELKWHRDEKDRRVKILECDGWMLQLDNELPVVLKEGKEYFIPKEVFHRTIKGNGNLVIEIKELD